VDDELNARQRKLLEVLESKGELGIRELASGLDVSERTVRNDLRSLVDRGRIGRRGRGPSTRYTVITHIK
jgi:DeoR/GlpR family transcriptional regulator of sugar metabolism